MKKLKLICKTTFYSYYIYNSEFFYIQYHKINIKDIWSC